MAVLSGTFPKVSYPVSAVNYFFQGIIYAILLNGVCWFQKHTYICMYVQCPYVEKKALDTLKAMGGGLKP